MTTSHQPPRDRRIEALRIGRKAATWTRALVRSNNPFVLLFITLLVYGALYRSLVASRFILDEVTPFFVIGNTDFVARYLRFMVREIRFSLVIAGGAFIIARVALFAARGRLPRFLRGLGWGSVFTLLAVIGFITGAYFEVLFAMHKGLDWATFVEGWEGAEGASIFGYATIRSMILLFGPCLLFLGLLLLPQRFRVWQPRVVGTLLVVMFSLQFPHHLIERTDPANLSMKQSLRRHPVWRFVNDAVHNIFREPNLLEKRAAAARVLDELKAPDVLSLLPPPRPERRFNVLVFLMESVGTQYVFDTSSGNPVPMPNLARLDGRGLSMERHYSTGNTSPRSIFSIFTGLYPLPRPHMFSTRPDVVIPTFATFLGSEYDKFFVTPGSLQFYFPGGLLRASGFAEMYGYTDIPGKRPGWRAGRNELDGMEFFLERLERATEPFLAVYYSYAPHYLYDDHGEEFRIFNDVGDPRNRYYNNLRLLDTVLGRILTQLEQSKQLDNTIIMAVGDHGEGFGQHKNNITHSRASYEENFQVPALFYNESLIPPMRVAGKTSHVDLMPTLLDILEIPHAPELFHGSTVFQDRRSPHIFLYGNENTISVIDENDTKLQVSLPRDKCWVFNLVNDPAENRRQSCDGQDALLDTALGYWVTQKTNLFVLNDRWREAYQ